MATENHAPLSKCGFSLALGLVWGLALLITGWFSMCGWATAFMNAMSSVYVGYSASFFGALRGAIWGFVDGAIMGWVFAYFYNMVLCKRKKG